MTYYSDGVHLYEVASKHIVENAGCFWRSGGRHGSLISFTVLHDVISEAIGTVGEFELLALQEVQP